MIPPAPLHRLIPSSGEELPVVGLGTWKTFDVPPDSGAAEPLGEVLREFVGGGGRVIDSSPMYGRAEEAVGTLAAQLELRPRLFLATKVWTTGRRRGIEEMARSLHHLRAEPIDLMQVHNLVDVDTQLATLRDWKRAGRIRYLGITHYTASAFGEVEALLRREPLDFLQINYSAAEREAESRLLPLAQEHGVAVLVNRPFATGVLLHRLARQPLPAWAAAMGWATWAQVLLAFAISHPAVTCAIPATASAGHVRENLLVASGPLPDDALRARIVEAVR